MRNRLLCNAPRAFPASGSTHPRHVTLFGSLIPLPQAACGLAFAT